MFEKTQFKKQLKRERVFKSVLAKVLTILAIVVAGLYIAGVIYFARHFYQNGTVFGIALKNKTIEQVKEEIQDKVDTYSIVVTTRDGDAAIQATDFGMIYDDAGEVDNLLKAQNPFLWPLMSRTSSDDIPIDVTWDNEALRDAVYEISYLQDDVMVAPTDAYLELQDDGYVIVPETLGNLVDKDKAYDQVLAAVTAGQENIDLDNEEDSCYQYPTIYQDYAPLVTECDGLNKIYHMTITYDFSDRTETLDGKTLNSWLKLNDDYTYTIVDSYPTQYVYDLGYKYDTFGQKRTFTTSTGETIELKGGDYGWCIDQPETVTALKNLILAGETVTVEPVYKYKGINRNTDDVSGNYVEINLTTQTMWVYSDGQCVVNTPVVTGCVAKNYDTPSGGVWAIDARITDYNLVGQGYDTEVSYWLPFNGNVGIHDATWRADFGGDIYLTNGSHGCVNTPLDQMATVYQYVQIGWPVVVYQTEDPHTKVETEPSAETENTEDVDAGELDTGEATE